MPANEAQLIAQLNAAVVQKSLLEPNFRALLVKDPKGTIEKVLGTSLPPGLNLKLIEATQNEYTIVLPYQPQTAADGEMSDSDLESVAGGSKSGATSFFKGLANGLSGGTAYNNDGSDEGNAGAMVGAIGGIGLGAALGAIGG